MSTGRPARPRLATAGLAKSVLQASIDGDEFADSSEVQLALVRFRFLSFVCPDSFCVLVGAQDRRLREGLTGAEWDAVYAAANERAREVHLRNLRERPHLERRMPDMEPFDPPDWWRDPDDMPAAAN